MGEYELRAAAFTKAEQARGSLIVAVVVGGAESEERVETRQAGRNKNTATNRGGMRRGGDGDCRQAGVRR